jgi:hypothetical protein
MINPAIFRKTLHDSAGLTAAAAVGIIGFVILFVWSMLNLGDEVLSFASRFSFLRKVFEAGFGIKVGRLGPFVGRDDRDLHAGDRWGN